MIPRYILIHTSASTAPDIDIRDVRAWHLQNGWSDVGYHYVVLDDNRHDKSRDGEVQNGRPEYQVGAHCKGLNHHSIGICLIGHGDEHAPTAAQLGSLVALCVELHKRYGIRWRNVLGHREVNRLVEGQHIAARYRTSKTCPGKLVDMDAIRQRVRLATRKSALY